MDKKIIKFGESKLEKYKFHQHKNLIEIYDVEINQILAFNKVSLGKKDFKYFIGYKDGNKSDHYAWSFQKRAHIEGILMKLDIFLFWQKMMNC